MVALEPGAQEEYHWVLGVSVCLAKWFVWTTTSGVGYEKSGDGALFLALLGLYVSQT